MRAGADKSNFKRAGWTVEPANAFGSVPVPVGPTTRKSYGPPSRPLGISAVRRSGASHRTSSSSTLPRKAWNVASTSTPPPWPTRWLATGSKCAPRIVAGTSAAVYADRGSIEDGAGGGSVDPFVQPMSNAHNAPARRTAARWAAARPMSRCALEHLKATPQSERIGVQRSAKVRQAWIGAQRYPRLGERHERTDPALDTHRQIRTGHHCDVRVRGRAGQLRAGEDGRELRARAQPAVEPCAERRAPGDADG